MSDLRSRIAHARRIVVKIGTSSLTDSSGQVSSDKIDAFARALSHRMSAGSEVILVSSGSIACGMGPLKLDKRPRDLVTKQAAAAAGQAVLAQQWAQSFAAYDISVAQVLLTAEDIGQRHRANNAHRAIDRLTQLGAVPVINENDTVATSEAQFGDNDRLAALTSHLVLADALFLFTDVDGLYTANPSDPDAQFIDQVEAPSDLIDVQAGSGGSLGTGGMATKLSAAQIASRSGVPVLLTSADKIATALDDASVGTVFAPSENRVKAWKFWALYAADVTGTLHLDQGALDAVVNGHKSLLGVGVSSVDGDFDAGDIVTLVGPHGENIGRGAVGYSSSQIDDLKGKRTEDVPEHLRKPVIHVDHLSSEL